MIKDVLRDIGGIGIYGVISICLFFGVFLSVLWWAGRLSRSELSAMAELPLRDGTGSDGEGRDER